MVGELTLAREVWARAYPRL